MVDRDLMEENALGVCRVLVVDDDQDINRLLQVRLKSRGFQVEGARNGEEALRVLDEGTQPDLMFLDVSMPGIGGLEVLKQVRTQGRNMAVIMMTAFGSEGVAIEALRQGADDYLRKPFEPGEFQAVVGRTVTKLELSRQNAALRIQLDQKRRQLEAELARAAVVQAALLPLTNPNILGFDMPAACHPAREVGGDFYDWHQREDDILTLTAGDVMGKGMPAALLMATVRGTLRALSQQNHPAAALDLAGRALEVDLERSGAFMTLFHGQLDVSKSLLSYVDAGHGHVFFRRAAGAIEDLQPRGRPLGATFEEGYHEGAAILGAGETLVVYSDGLIDARPELSLNPQGIANRLVGATSAQQMVDCLVELATQAGPLPDDLTVVVLCRQGGLV